MSYNFAEVAGLARQGAEKMRWLIELADAMERLGALDTAASETELRLNTLRADEVALKTELDELSKRVQSARESAEAAINDAQRMADRIVAAANARADEIAKAAVEKAQKVEDDTALTAMSTLDDARRKSLLALNARDEANAEAEKAHAALESLRADTAAEQDKLDKLKAAIAGIVNQGA